MLLLLLIPIPIMRNLILVTSLVISHGFLQQSMSYKAVVRNGQLQTSHTSPNPLTCLLWSIWWCIWFLQGWGDSYVTLLALMTGAVCSYHGTNSYPTYGHHTHKGILSYDIMMETELSLPCFLAIVITWFLLSPVSHA